MSVAGVHSVCANTPAPHLALLDAAAFLATVCLNCRRLRSTNVCTLLRRILHLHCSYDYDEVSFLLEVYGHLEEPDGIAGEFCGGALAHLQWLLSGWGLYMPCNACMQVKLCLWHELVGWWWFA
jgi:hypothetical protein